MTLFTLLLIAGLFSSVSGSENKNISDTVVNDIDGNPVKLSDYHGKVLLIVNVASKCGFTPQYKGLQSLYQKYHEKGFEILAFPCNDFAGQEPGSAEEIKQFCSVNYQVTFPLFEKITLKGKNASPLFKILTDNPVTGKSSVKWNFEKFIIDKEGNIVKRFRSITKPESKKIIKQIEALLER